jgi:hypothetical protein
LRKPFFNHRTLRVLYPGIQAVNTATRAMRLTANSVKKPPQCEMLRPKEIYQPIYLLFVVGKQYRLLLSKEGVFLSQMKSICSANIFSQK